MALFLSTILNKMDAKCRVSVPSAFRNSLQKQTFKGVIAFPSYQNNSIDACGIDRMENISDSLDRNNEYTKEEFDLISLYFGEAEQLPFDKEGRIILPKGKVVDEDFVFTYYDGGRQSVSGTNVRTGVSHYEYETSENNKKRQIQILRLEYLQQFLNDFRDIMVYDKSSQYVDETTATTENSNLMNSY